MSDLIKREEALMALTGMDLPTDKDKLIALFNGRIKALSAVEPQEKIGHWIINTDLGYFVSICSCCDWRGHGDTKLIYKPNYCPNCGAKMVKEIKNERQILS